MTASTNVNLAAKSAEERAAIELDKQRWTEAFRISSTMYPHEIRAWLAQQVDVEFKEDMRRGLNAQRGKYEIKNNGAGSSHKRRAG